jgi:hypothetical protein
MSEPEWPARLEIKRSSADRLALQHAGTRHCTSPSPDWQLLFCSGSEEEEEL